MVSSFVVVIVNDYEDRKKDFRKIAPAEDIECNRWSDTDLDESVLQNLNFGILCLRKMLGRSRKALGRSRSSAQ